MASHVVGPPSMLHVVSEKSDTISDFSDAVPFPFFPIVSNDVLCGVFLKWIKMEVIGKTQARMIVRINDTVNPKKVTR